MTNKCGRTRQRTNNLRDELIWGMNSVTELATVYYYTRRSIRSGSQSTLTGDKAWCIIAPIERYSVFILHRLRNEFLQLILISLDSASWELHKYSRRICGPMKKIPMLTPAPRNRTRDLKTARPTLYLTTTDTIYSGYKHFQ